MKLSEFPAEFWRIMSNEEKDLERQVVGATFKVVLKDGNKTIIHEWNYSGKEVKNNGPKKES